MSVCARAYVRATLCAAQVALVLVVSRVKLAGKLVRGNLRLCVRVCVCVRALMRLLARCNFARKCVCARARVCAELVLHCA